MCSRSSLKVSERENSLVLLLIHLKELFIAFPSFFEQRLLAGVICRIYFANVSKCAMCILVKQLTFFFEFCVRITKKSSVLCSIL